jgi:hypothetical protein
MDRTGSPERFWILSLNLTVYILNRLATESLKWLTPYEKEFGQKLDISAILAFRWWEPVYYAETETYPTTKERLAHMVGVAEHQGAAMTWLLLDDVTQQVVFRSAVRTALDHTSPNLRAEQPLTELTAGLSMEAGETDRPIHSVSDLSGQLDTSNLKLPRFSPDELMGMTFLRELENGNSCRAKIVQKILDKDAKNNQHIKFLVKVGDNDYD